MPWRATSWGSGAAKLQAHLLDAVRLRLEADCAGLVFGPYGGGGGLTRGAEALWDRELAGAFLRREGPLLPATVVLTPLVRGRRQLGVLGAVRRERPFGRSARRTLDRLCGVLAQELERREEERLARVLDRIRGKIVSELRPRDLAYQILDGLHQLVDYDHSSAFLMWDPTLRAFRIEAEKIVWTKSKSAWVGCELSVPAELVAELEWSRASAGWPGTAAAILSGSCSPITGAGACRRPPACSARRFSSAASSSAC